MNNDNKISSLYDHDTNNAPKRDVPNNEPTKSDTSNKLIIRTFGGTEGVNKNLTTYEYGDDMILFDCGIGFPDIFEMPGVDVLIPDFTYVVQNAHKIRGLFITHAHEDHVGAIPFLLQELDHLDIYSGSLVQEFLKIKLTDRAYKTLIQKVSFHLIDSTLEPVKLGKFSISAIHVNHSIPETMGYAVKTDQGTVLHIAEYKFDDTPVLDKPIEIDKIKKYGDAGVLCLVSDCLLSTTEGHTASEKTLDNTFFDLFEKAGKRQLFVTTMSSNISRMAQITSAAVRYGRKLVPSGRSIEQMVDIARRLGYLPFPSDAFVSEQNASGYDQSQLVYLIAGCYGQSGSSLDRVSRNEHEHITLKDNALVIFSGDPAPPGSDIMVGKMTDQLILSGCEVIYGAIQDNLHISGHAAKEDMIHMAQLVKPKYFMPIGGTVTKMKAFENLMAGIGFKKETIFECLEGEGLEFSNGAGKKTKRIETTTVFANTNTADKLNPVIVRDRERLSEDGVLVVVIPKVKNNRLLGDKVEVVTRGFVYVSDSQELINKSKKVIAKIIGNFSGSQKEWDKLRHKIERELDKFLYKETGRSPLIIVHQLAI